MASLAELYLDIHATRRRIFATTPLRMGAAMNGFFERSRAAKGLIFLAHLALFSGCRLADTYLVPRRSFELVSALQPNLRPHAQLPALREADRSPVLVDYRALEMTDRELETLLMRQPAGRSYRARAAVQHPLFIAGGVILGMGLPHLALGLGVMLDKPTPEESRAFTDLAGSAVSFTVGGLHIAAGALMMVIGGRKPRIEPATTELVDQYTNPEP